MDIADSAATRLSAFVADFYRKQADNSMHQQPLFDISLSDGGIPTSPFCNRGPGLTYNANLHMPA